MSLTASSSLRQITHEQLSGMLSYLSNSILKDATVYRYMSTCPMHVHLSMNNFLHSINITCEIYTVILEYENFLSQMLVMKHEKLTEEFYLPVHSTKEVLLKCYI